MTTALDSKILPIAKALLLRYGISAIFTVDAGTYSTTTGKSTASLSSVTRKITPPEQKTRWAPGESNHRERYTLVYLAASGLNFTPVLGMKVTIGGTGYAIVASTAIRSGDLVALWALELA